jgi:hypothetical protein
MNVSGVHIELFYFWGNNPQYQVERVDWPQSQSAHDCEEGPVFVCRELNAGCSVLSLYR